MGRLLAQIIQVTHSVHLERRCAGQSTVEHVWLSQGTMKREPQSKEIQIREGDGEMFSFLYSSCACERALLSERPETWLERGEKKIKQITARTK